MTGRLAILWEAFHYSATALVAQALGLISGFVVAKVLGPSDFGVWNAVSLALVYVGFSDLGVLPAMARDVPVYLGQGDSARARRTESVALGVTLVSTAIFALGVLVLGVYVGSGVMRVGLFGMAMMVAAQRLYSYYLTVLRCYGEFGWLSRLQTILAIVSTLLAIALVLWWGFVGRVAAAVVSQLALLGGILWFRKWGIWPSLDLKILRQLITTGIPIVAASVIVGLLTTVDRLLIVSYLGETQLGHFGLALLMTSVVSLIPSMSGQVLYPRMTFRYGEAGQNPEALRPFVLRPPIMIGLFLPLLIGPLYLILPTVVAEFLPAYTPGIVAARIVLLGIFFFGIIGTTDYFLVTIGKLRPYITIAFVALMVNVILDLIALKLGYGIEGVAITGTVISYAIYALLLIGYALRYFMSGVAAPMGYLFKVVGPFAYMCLLLLLIESLLQSATKPAVFIRLVLYIAGVVPLAVQGIRELGINAFALEFTNARSSASREIS